MKLVQKDDFNTEHFNLDNGNISLKALPSNPILEVGFINFNAGLRGFSGFIYKYGVIAILQLNLDSRHWRSGSRTKVGTVPPGFEPVDTVAQSFSHQGSTTYQCEVDKQGNVYMTVDTAVNNTYRVNLVYFLKQGA